MPILDIQTTMSPDAFPADFSQKLTAVAATIFKLSQNVMIVRLATDQKLYIGGGEPELVFLMKVYNGDDFQDREENLDKIKKFFNFLTQEMTIPEKSIRVILINIPATQIGLPPGKLLKDVREELRKAQLEEQRK